MSVIYPGGEGYEAKRGFDARGLARMLADMQPTMQVRALRGRLALLEVLVCLHFLITAWLAWKVFR